MNSFQENELLKKYYKKLVAENVLKSFSYGLTVAAVANFITAFICWFTTDLGLWISLGVFAVVLAVSVPCLYFFEFKPSINELAKRLDSLGLDERMISMLEFGSNGTYIGDKITEDATNALSLKAASGVGLKICISALSICLCACTVAAGIGMTTVAALAGSGTIPSGDKWGDVINPPAEIYIEVNYVVVGITSDGEEVIDLGGMIEGDDFQLVVDGGTTTPVLAVADDEWFFLGWNDSEENTDPYRYDTGITGEGGVMGEDGQIIINYYAVFVEMNDGDGGGGDGNGQPQESDENGGGEGDEPQDGPPSENENSGNSDSPTDPDSDSDSDGASGKEKPNNQVIDGQQYYRERYEEYLQKAQEYIDRGEEVPQKIKDLIKYYFDMIK